MHIHRYPWFALVSDYVRAIIGVALGVAPLFILQGKPIVIGIFGAIALLFAGFGVRTVIKHRMELRVDEHEIRINLPRPRAIAWRNVSGVRLKYFTPRRKKRGGWFQLIVTGPAGSIAVDSGLSDFTELAARARAAAEQNGIALDGASTANFEALVAPIQIDDL